MYILNYALIGIAIWLIIDGIYSIYRYWNAPIVDPVTHETKQGWPDHIIRIIRSGCGVFIFLVGLGVIKFA